MLILSLKDAKIIKRTGCENDELSIEYYRIDNDPWRLKISKNGILIHQGYYQRMIDCQKMVNSTISKLTQSGTRHGINSYFGSPTFISEHHH